MKHFPGHYKKGIRKFQNPPPAPFRARTHRREARRVLFWTESNQIRVRDQDFGTQSIKVFDFIGSFSGKNLTPRTMGKIKGAAQREWMSHEQVTEFILRDLQASKEAFENSWSDHLKFIATISSAIIGLEIPLMIQSEKLASINAWLFESSLWAFFSAVLTYGMFWLAKSLHDHINLKMKQDLYNRHMNHSDSLPWDPFESPMGRKLVGFLSLTYWVIPLAFFTGLVLLILSVTAR